MDVEGFNASDWCLGKWKYGHNIGAFWVACDDRDVNIKYKAILEKSTVCERVDV